MRRRLWTLEITFFRAWVSYPHHAASLAAAEENPALRWLSLIFFPA